MAVRDLGRAPHIFDDAEEIGRLNDDGRGLIADLPFEIGKVETAALARVLYFNNRHALMLGVGGEHFAILGMHGARDQYAVPAGQPHGHHGGFGNRGRTVVHRRVGGFHARELAEHGLKFEDRGEGALRDFRLVGRVGRQELCAGHHRIHQHGPVMMVDARA